MEECHHQLVVDGEFADEFSVDVPQNLLVGGDVEGVGFHLLGEVNDDLEGEAELTAVGDHVVANQFGLEERCSLVDNQVDDVAIADWRCLAEAMAEASAGPDVIEHHEREQVARGGPEVASVDEDDALAGEDVLDVEHR